MLKEQRIPTQLVAPHELPPVPIRDDPRAGNLIMLRTLARLLRFGCALFWATRVRREPAQQIALRVRGFLEELGGLWVKAGQLMSLRADLLTPEMSRELTDLQYLAEGFDPHESRAMVERSLGRSLAEVFDWFEERPFAAASVSQIHHARLRAEGARVVVKVQRPGIARLFARDLAMIAWLMRQNSRLPAFRYFTWQSLIRELRQMMQEESDYRYEAANLRRMRKLLRRHKVYAPKVFERYSSPTVLVMEYIPGVLMSDYLRLERSDPARVQAWCAENNVRPRKVGARLLLSFYRQLYEDGVFHGDLHPGNIMLLRDSRLALIDFGSIGSMDARAKSVYRKFSVAIAQRDFTRAADMYLLLAENLPPFDVQAYRADMVEVLRTWEARTRLRGLSYLEKSFTGGVANELQLVTRKYKINPYWQYTRSGRAQVTLDASLSVLLRDTTELRVLRRYARLAQRRDLRRLRQGGLRALVGAVSSAGEAAGYAADSLRRRAIQFEGAISTGARVGLTILAVLHAVLLLGMLALAYAVVHQHAFGLVRRIHAWLGVFDRGVELIPLFPLELGLAALVLAALLARSLGRLRRSLAQPRVRLPNGQIDA